MELSHLLKGVKNYTLYGNARTRVGGLTDDSRKVKKGFLFIALSGLTNDGNSFINRAIKSGASVIVSESWAGEKTLGVTFVQVSNAREALGQIAGNFYKHPDKRLKVIGVTGTKGKTTTSYFIYQILTKLGKKVGVVTSVSAKIGMRNYDTGFHVTNPDCIALFAFLSQMQKAGCDYAVLEVSSHGIHQKRIAGIDFMGAVLTNIAPEHLDYHKTFDSYRKVKLSFLQSAKSVVLNSQEQNFDYLKSKLAGKKIFTYALRGSDQFSASAFPEAKNYPGDFNSLNFLAALAGVHALGIPVEVLQKNKFNLDLPKGRLEFIANKTGINVVVDFAHTPDSFFNALSYLKSVTNGNLIVVFGSAGERDPYKRPKMGKVAAEIADYVILTTEDPRTEKSQDIMVQIKSGVAGVLLKKVVMIANRENAIKHAIAIAKTGDTVALLGKGHETSMNLDGLHEIPWSDEKVARKYLK